MDPSRSPSDSLQKHLQTREGIEELLSWLVEEEHCRTFEDLIIIIADSEYSEEYDKIVRKLSPSNKKWLQDEISSRITTPLARFLRDNGMSKLIVPLHRNGFQSLEQLMGFVLEPNNIDTSRIPAGDFIPIRNALKKLVTPLTVFLHEKGLLNQFPVLYNNGYTSIGDLVAEEDVNKLLSFGISSDRLSGMLTNDEIDIASAVDNEYDMNIKYNLQGPGVVGGNMYRFVGDLRDHLYLIVDDRNGQLTFYSDSRDYDIDVSFFYEGSKRKVFLCPGDAQTLYVKSTMNVKNCKFTCWAFPESPDITRYNTLLAVATAKLALEAARNGVPIPDIRKDNSNKEETLRTCKLLYMKASISAQKKSYMTGPWLQKFYNSEPDKLTEVLKFGMLGRDTEMEKAKRFVEEAFNPTKEHCKPLTVISAPRQGKSLFLQLVAQHLREKQRQGEKLVVLCRSLNGTKHSDQFQSDDPVKAMKLLWNYILCLNETEFEDAVVTGFEAADILRLLYVSCDIYLIIDELSIITEKVPASAFKDLTRDIFSFSTRSTCLIYSGFDSFLNPMKTASGRVAHGVFLPPVTPETRDYVQLLPMKTAMAHFVNKTQQDQYLLFYELSKGCPGIIGALLDVKDLDSIPILQKITSEPALVLNYLQEYVVHFHKYQQLPTVDEDLGQNLLRNKVGVVMSDCRYGRRDAAFVYIPPVFAYYAVTSSKGRTTFFNAVCKLINVVRTWTKLIFEQKPKSNGSANDGAPHSEVTGPGTNANYWVGDNRKRLRGPDTVPECSVGADVGCLRRAVTEKEDVLPEDRPEIGRVSSIAGRNIPRLQEAAAITKKEVVLPEDLPKVKQETRMSALQFEKYIYAALKIGYTAEYSGEENELNYSEKMSFRYPELNRVTAIRTMYKGADKLFDAIGLGALLKEERIPENLERITYDEQRSQEQLEEHLQIFMTSPLSTDLNDDHYKKIRGEFYKCQRTGNKFDFSKLSEEMRAEICGKYFALICHINKLLTDRRMVEWGDNFMFLGPDSLRAVDIITRIQHRETWVQIKFALVYPSPKRLIKEFIQLVPSALKLDCVHSVEYLVVGPAPTGYDDGKTRHPLTGTIEERQAEFNRLLNEELASEKVKVPQFISKGKTLSVRAVAMGTKEADLLLSPLASTIAPNIYALNGVSHERPLRFSEFTDDWSALDRRNVVADELTEEDLENVQKNCEIAISMVNDMNIVRMKETQSTEVIPEDDWA